jgi:hypothetical protein
MITTLWTIGFILFIFSLIFMQISDLPSSFRSYHKWEARALTSMILAVLCFGIAMYSTSREKVNENETSINKRL